MKRIVLDAELRAKLGDLTEEFEFVDDRGQPIAEVKPIEWEYLTPPITQEELERRARTPQKVYSLEQVLAHLKSLESR